MPVVDAPSQEQRLGISILVYTPAALGTPAFVERVDTKLKAYGHEINAVGGYLNATLTILSELRDLELWMENGLGRHIEVYNSYGAQIWEGFVNTISLTSGGFNIERGPLLDVVNRCSVEYTPIIDPDEDPPIMGTKTETTIAEDATSQAKYGILEKVVAGGNLLDDGTTNDAEYVRDAFLEENREARSSHEISLAPGEAGEISLNISCRGYMDWLELYAYNDTTCDADCSVWASDKIISVLGADPNGLFSTDYGDIEDNGLLVNGDEVENRTAGTVIKEVLSCGDINNNRYLFGFYNGRKAKYNVVPTSAEYHYYRYSKNQAIETIGGERIYPWDLKPGRWAFIPDLLPGMSAKSDIKTDPRMLFIENVAFTAPYSVTMQGSPVLNMAQLMARIGLGMGA